MTLSGWCSAPIGARPKCGGCRAVVCSCACHRNGESLSTKGKTVLGMSGQVCENGDGPNREVRATQPGPDHLIDLGERG